MEIITSLMIKLRGNLLLHQGDIDLDHEILERQTEKQIGNLTQSDQMKLGIEPLLSIAEIDLMIIILQWHHPDLPPLGLLQAVPESHPIVTNKILNLYT